MLMNKKGQGLPMNVVILGIIVIVVLIVVLVFFVGGTGQFTQKIKQILGLNVKGEELQLATQSCIRSCESVAERTPIEQKNSFYCNGILIVDNDANIDTPPIKTKCGDSSTANTETLSASEERQGIKLGRPLDVPCEISCA